MFLDEIKPKKAIASHGYIGTNGKMGYTIIPSIRGINYTHSISAHASSIMEYEINEKYKSFHSYIGLNDSSSDDAKCLFQVISDSKILYESSIIKKQDKIVPVDLDITGCKSLELRCINKGNNLCHSIWIDPVLSENAPAYFTGAFNNSIADLRLERRKTKYAIILFATENVSKYLYVYLKTFIANSNLEDYTFYITCPDNSYVIKKIAKHFNAIFVPIEATQNYNLTSPVDIKDVSYSLPRFIDSEYFIISDIDMLIMGDLNECFVEGIGICKDFNTERFTFGQLIESEWSAYNGNSKALDLLDLGEAFHSKTIINCGFITGKKQDFNKIDCELRKMLPQSQFYLFESNGSFCREQALINLSIIRTNNYTILDDTYNYQLLHSECQEKKVIHLNGTPTKEKYKDLINKYLDEDYLELKQSIFQEITEGYSSILNWSNIYIPNAIFVEKNNYIDAKKLLRNKYDMIIVDLNRSPANIKIVIEMCKQIDFIFGIVDQEKLNMLKSLDIETEIIGNDKDVTIVKIKL